MGTFPLCSVVLSSETRSLERAKAAEHDLTPADWAFYMDFADRHGWRR